MMKIVAFTFALFLFVQTTSAQTDTTTSRHILYAEGGGIGGYVSVNYENVFFQQGIF
jgi:hypothetical protein